VLSLIIFFILLGLGVGGLVRGLRGGQRERKQLIQALIFIVGIFLFLVALTPGFFPNHYDSGHVSGPVVVPTPPPERGYRMYFSGYALAVTGGRDGVASTGVAESADGITWAKRKSGPVLGPSLAKFSDAYAVAEPAVVKRGDTWYQFYIGTSSAGTTTIALATSADGLSWNKCPDNPVLTPQRPIPSPDEVKGWSDEQVNDFLASRGYTDDFFAISKRAWLIDLLGIAQRQADPAYKDAYRAAVQEVRAAQGDEKKDLRKTRDALRLRYLGDPGFYPLLRIKALERIKLVLGSEALGDFAVAPTTTYKDLWAVKEKIDARFKAKGIKEPAWQDVAVMADDEVSKLVADLGVPDEAFAIPKKQFLLMVARTLAGEVGWAEALPYFKITYPKLASEGASHIGFFQIYRDLKAEFAGSVDGKGFADLSVIYDEAADEFRLWTVANGFHKDVPDALKGSYVVYATSTDGVRWQRIPWTGLQQMSALRGVSALSVIREDDGYTAAFVKGGNISIGHSPDGVVGWTLDRRDVVVPGERPAFDSKGIVSVALLKAGDGYHVWYSGEALDSDKPLPTLDELAAMPNRELFKLGKIVGCRMGWNKDECRRFLSYARDFVDRGSTYVKVINALGKQVQQRTSDGAIFGPDYDDTLVRAIVERYDVEVAIEDPADLLKIDRDDLIWSIRKVFLSRCLVKYGRSLEYPTPEQVDTLSADELVALCPQYGVQCVLPLPDPAAELSEAQRQRLVKSLREGLYLYERYNRERLGQDDYPVPEEVGALDLAQLVEACRVYDVQCIMPQPESAAGLSDAQVQALRTGLRTFSVLCRGEREDLDAFSQKDLVKIAANHSVLVTLGRTRHMLKRNLASVNPDLLRMMVELTVRARVEDYLKTQPRVTRIGLATSADGATWNKVEGSGAFGCVLDARGRFESARNKLQSQIEPKVADYLVLLGWMAAFLGTINLFRHHGTIVLRRRANWLYSSVFFLSLFFMLICSAIYYPKSVAFVRVPDPVHFAENFIADPLIATILGLLGFYITSAAYRAFRIKNVEATVMMLVAVFVMLGNVPALEPLTRNGLLHTVFDQLHFPLWRDWIMSKGNAAVFRALNFGLAIGVVAMSIRIIFGIERGAFFEKL
jgi:predicted GH43/DUF377 family glycosyl hydrolase